MKKKILDLMYHLSVGNINYEYASKQVLDLFAVSLDDATKVAVRISEEAITPPLDAKEQAMFIAGFQECIKWLNVFFGNDR